MQQPDELHAASAAAVQSGSGRRGASDGTAATFAVTLSVVRTACSDVAKAVQAAAASQSALYSLEPPAHCARTWQDQVSVRPIAVSSQMIRAFLDNPRTPEAPRCPASQNAAAAPAATLYPRKLVAADLLRRSRAVAQRVHCLRVQG